MRVEAHEHGGVAIFADHETEADLVEALGDWTDGPVEVCGTLQGREGFPPSAFVLVLRPGVIHDRARSEAMWGEDGVLVDAAVAALFGQHPERGGAERETAAYRVVVAVKGAMAVRAAEDRVNPVTVATSPISGDCAACGRKLGSQARRLPVGIGASALYCMDALGCQRAAANRAAVVRSSLISVATLAPTIEPGTVLALAERLA